ncbi:MAG: hypothetical protein KA519_07260 [Bacteroides sp.]|uniref:hypothetical protein n=1 Tax=Bacteroides sp. TaxID=29523 RepID=UPI001B5CA458|nr:hypothetical protein [Bacteroides sp.]MBP6067854.1 hypothetical protein [Bacteroides sp.]
MNHLIARIKGRGQVYKNVISEKEPFSLPDDLANPVEYNPDHNLDDDQWFAINDFSQKEFCLKLLRPNFDSTDYDSITSIDTNKSDFLCSYQNNNEYYFQKISRTQVINKKWFYVGGSVSYEENKGIIVINSFPDAIYLKSVDKLYFKKLTTIATIFKGIDVLYREATDVETTTFLENDFVMLENDFCAAKVKKANRQRIAMAVDTLSNLDPVQKITVFDYVKDYCPNLEFSENTFKIKSENDLKYLLYGIEQRYYTTIVGDEKRLANSVIKIGPQPAQVLN